MTKIKLGAFIRGLNMNTINIVFILISLGVGIVAFLTSFNIIIGIAITLIFLAYYFFIARKMFIKYLQKIDQIHCCYHFINSFIITLSVKESFDDAYESATRLTNKNFSDEVNELSSMPIENRIVYLRKYFNLAIYKMFLNVLKLYQDQGGDILAMSDSLMRETTRTEKSLTESVALGNRKLLEFGVLWLMSFAILLFLRFGISEFYEKMITNYMFIILLVGFFLVSLVSTHLFLCSFTSIKIKEDKV